MANLNVSYEQIGSARNALEKTRGDVISLLETMKGKISELTSSGFVTDRTSKAFNEAYAKYTKGATTTIEGINDVANFLKKVEDTLRSTDQQLAASIG
jgi:uncharacterized protein YukE